MIEKLKELIISANEAYRAGNPIISDKEYDELIENLEIISPNDELLIKIGHVILDETRKSKLPIVMASMNKTKTLTEIETWCRLRGISTSEEVIITPKFDGLSLCVNESNDNAWTRGDGEFGQKSDEHYRDIQNHLNTPEASGFNFTFGEVMISKNTFQSKFANLFANPRNLVAGLLNSPDTQPYLTDCHYIKYGASISEEFKSKYITKQQIIDTLNSGQDIKVEYHICKISDLTEEFLIDLFHKFSTEFEIDGLIIEINKLNLQELLGRENSGNPAWARAFKHKSFEQTAETDVIGISWNISKNGLLKPIIHIVPVKLDGVTISNVTGNNARFIRDMGIGVGAKVIIRRSGMVIPIIDKVTKPVDFVLPIVEGVEIGWSESGIELITLTETEEQRFKQAVSFFEILEAENISEGIIRQIWDAGYTTIKDILRLTKDDLEKIDRFGKRKATIVFNSIQKCTKDVSLSKLQHATGFFVGLGSKKLILLDDFKTKPSIDEVMKIEGFAETSANIYVDSYDAFFDYIKDLPVTIKQKEEVILAGDDLKGMNVVFTGIRRADIELIIESRGGKIGSGVSKNTTHLVCKDPNSGSSKLEKAKSFGINILSVEELEKFLNK